MHFEHVKRRIDHKNMFNVSRIAKYGGRNANRIETPLRDLRERNPFSKKVYANRRESWIRIAVKLFGYGSFPGATNHWDTSPLAPPQQSGECINPSLHESQTSSAAFKPA